jgi:hypothetical protein
MAPVERRGFYDNMHTMITKKISVPLLVAGGTTMLLGYHSESLIDGCALYCKSPLTSLTATTSGVAVYDAVAIDAQGEYLETLGFEFKAPRVQRGIKF